MLLSILTLIGSALAIGAVVYLAVKLTTALLKTFRKRKTSKILTAHVKDLVDSAPKINLDDLDDDDVILAEYDMDKDELVQDIQIAHRKDVDQKVDSLLRENGGIVVFE